MWIYDAYYQILSFLQTPPFSSISNILLKPSWLETACTSILERTHSLKW